jgi:hypothetical protein
MTAGRQYDKLRALVEPNFTTSGAGIDLLVLAKHMTETGTGADSQRLSGAQNISNRTATESKSDAHGSPQDHAESPGIDLEAVRAIKQIIELNERAHGSAGEVSSQSVEEAIAKSLKILEQLPAQWVVTSADHSVPESGHGVPGHPVTMDDFPGVISLQAWIPSQGNHAAEQAGAPAASVGANNTSKTYVTDHTGASQAAHDDGRSHSSEFASSSASSAQDAVASTTTKPVVADVVQLNLPPSGAVSVIGTSVGMQHSGVLDSLHTSSQAGTGSETATVVEHAVTAMTTADPVSPPATDPAPIADISTTDDAGAGVFGSKTSGQGTEPGPVHVASLDPLVPAPAIPDPAPAGHENSGTSSSQLPQPSPGASSPVISPTDQSHTGAVLLPLPASQAAEDHASADLGHSPNPAASSPAGTTTPTDHDTSITASTGADPAAPAPVQDTPATPADAASAGESAPSDHDTSAVASTGADPTAPAPVQDAPATADASGAHDATADAASAAPGDHDTSATASSGADPTAPAPVQDAPAAAADVTDAHAPADAASASVQLLLLPESHVLSSATAEVESGLGRSSPEVGELKPVEYTVSATAASQAAYADYSMPDLNAPPHTAEVFRAALGLPPSTDTHADIDHPYNGWTTTPGDHSIMPGTGENSAGFSPLSGDMNAHHLDPQLTSAHYAFEDVNFTSWHSH